MVGFAAEKETRNKDGLLRQRVQDLCKFAQFSPDETKRSALQDCKMKP
jgi:hypothetical protein